MLALSGVGFLTMVVMAFVSGDSVLWMYLSPIPIALFFFAIHSSISQVRKYRQLDWALKTQNPIAATLVITRIAPQVKGRPRIAVNVHSTEDALLKGEYMCTEPLWDVKPWKGCEIACGIYVDPNSRSLAVIQCSQGLLWRVV